MKVLKKGSAPAGWNKKLTCTGAGNNTMGCGATLLVLEEDVFVIRQSNRHDIEYNQGRFFCPECGTVTDLGETDNKNCRPHGKKPTEKTLRVIRAAWNARSKKKRQPSEETLRKREQEERGTW